MTRIAYFLKRAFLHLARSLTVTGVTVGTVAVVFLLLSVFALVGYNLSLLADRLGEGLRLNVFLADDCDASARDAIRKRLEESSKVSSVVYISRAEALEKFKKRLGARAVVLDGLQNPVPASLQATFISTERNPASIGELAQKVVNLPGVEDVQYGQAWLDKFFRFVGTSRMLGLVIGILVVLAAGVIISNTIRLSVFARREEIQILKLVGATDGFIKAPFYIEGILLGLLGAAIGTLIAWAAFIFLVSNVFVSAGLATVRMGISFLPLPAVGAIVLTGGFLGALGTVSSLWRYMKV
jgi:cell division transport system permease protein